MADFDFINTSADDIVRELITGVEAQIQEPLYPGDERRIFCEALAVEIVALFNKLNDASKQRLLRYARNEQLDALGERMQTARLAAEPAKTILRFSLAAARDRGTYINAGTRATADGAHHFATSAAAIIPAGEISIDVDAECTIGGSAANGYTPGSIQTLTDAVPYIAGVTNIDTTHDGDDGEPQDDGGDGDDRYRERIRQAPAKFSTAGAEAAYIYHAMAASSIITDVRIPEDHEPGTVDIIVMTEEGDPSETIIEAVLEACNKRNIRPLGDLVQVMGPERIPFDIDIKYYSTAENEAACVRTIEGTGGAIDKYIAWQQASIGRDINPDKLRAFCLAPDKSTDTTLAGAIRIEITSPTQTALTERQLAEFSGTINVTHEVVTE